jgi:hypothetical protein
MNHMAVVVSEPVLSFICPSINFVEHKKPVLKKKKQRCLDFRT